MVYNLGTSDHPIGDIRVRVDDASYHVVKFTRQGANSTLQIDDYNMETHYPAGHQLAVFNTQAVLQIGGRWNPAKQRVERPFQGIMSGLVVNGQRVLDLAAEKDAKTSMRGVVQVVTGIHSRGLDPFQRMQQVRIIIIFKLNKHLLFISKFKRPIEFQSYNGNVPQKEKNI